MKVSFLISSYNGQKDIVTLLKSIEKLILGSHQIEVVLRDDNSSDRTAKVVSEKYPWVKLINGKATLGFAKSMNIAFEAATGEILCGVNQDVVLEERFLLEGLLVLEKHPEAIGVNTNMIMPWIMSLKEFISTPSKLIPAYEYQLTNYGYAQYVSVRRIIRETNLLQGGGFLMRLSALRKGENLFDPKIYMYCEDTELSLRLRKQGRIFLYAPKAILFHNQKAKNTRSLDDFKKLVKVTCTRFYVMAKHHDPGTFTRNFLLYVWGIIIKMNYLGLPLNKRIMAYLSGGCLSILFLILFPYWLWYSIHISSENYMEEKPTIEI